MHTIFTCIQHTRKHIRKPALDAETEQQRHDRATHFTITLLGQQHLSPT